MDRRLRLSSLRTGSWELYVMNADGSDITQLTFDTRREMSPAWSPDGQTLAYRAVFDNHWEIAVRTLDGPESRLTFLGDQMEVGEAAWSPNGKTLVIELDKDLYLMSANGAGLMPLTDSPTWDRGPNWQPLRTTLEVTAYIDGRSQLVIQQGAIYWHHFDFAAPGRHFDAPGGNVPTYFNGDPWFPVWPGDPPDHNPADPIDNEVRCGDCTTLDQYEQAPPLATDDQIVALNAVDARGDMSIVQQPAPDNAYTLIVEFDDNSQSGPEWYTVVLAYDRAPLTPTNDSYVTQRRPTKSFGSRHRLLVQNAARDTDTYIKFNAARAGGTVVQATLRLYVVNPGPDGGRLYAVSPYYKGTNDLWLENELTWRNAPDIDGLPLASLRRVSRQEWVEVDVTQTVIDALENQNGRVSLALHNRSRNRVTFSSKEGEHPPELLLTTR